jgi:hypothetical protein
MTLGIVNLDSIKILFLDKIFFFLIFEIRKQIIKPIIVKIITVLIVFNEGILMSHSVVSVSVHNENLLKFIHSSISATN